VTAERLLQQQVQQLTSELAVTQVSMISQGGSLLRMRWHTTAVASLVLITEPRLHELGYRATMRSATCHDRHSHAACWCNLCQGARMPGLLSPAGCCVQR
jgi:hypothetical protein